MRKIFFVIILFALCNSANSQLFWKITGKNLKKPSYLFATSPYIATTIIDSIPGIFTRFMDCSVVIGETSINKIDYEAKVYNAALLPQNITLKKFISKNDTAFVNKEIKDVLKLNLNEISALKPGIIINFYQDEIIKRTLLTENETDINSVFQSLAAEKGKIVEGVNDAKDYIKQLSDTTNLQEQADKLVTLLTNKDVFQNEILKLSSIYKSGNIEIYYNTALFSKYACHLPDKSFLNDLNKTNLNWISKLNEVIKTENAFIVTDILRLHGENGLIQLLRNDGYKVVEVGK